MANEDNGKLEVGTGYQGYSLGTGLKRAALLFRQKYGRAPAQVTTAGCIILAGPIGANGRQSLTAQAEAATSAMTAETALQLALEGLEGVTA